MLPRSLLSDDRLLFRINNKISHDYDTISPFNTESTQPMAAIIFGKPVVVKASSTVCLISSLIFLLSRFSALEIFFLFFNKKKIW